MNPDEIRALIDERACRDVLMRYGRALDWLDAEGVSAVFWPDASVDYGFFRGSAEEFVPVVMAVEKTAARRFHLTGGEVIRMLSETIATAESYGVTQAVTPTREGGTMASVFYGRYLDRLEKRSGEWRIAARRYLLHAAYSADYTEASAMKGLPKADDLSPEHPLFAHLSGSEQP